MGTSTIILLKQVASVTDLVRDLSFIIAGGVGRKWGVYEKFMGSSKNGRGLGEKFKFLKISTHPPPPIINERSLSERPGERESFV